MKMRSTVNNGWSTAGALVATICVAAGCATTSAAPGVPATLAGDAAAITAGELRIANAPSTPEENVERLVRLHAERSAERGAGEYVLGTGDVLSVRAFGFDELSRRVRVEDDGTIVLPLVGNVPVAGMTVAAAQHGLTERLGSYMYDPHVALFVEEYRSQQVAVVGSVRTPGPVTLTNRQLTVLDALTAAGGMTDAAAGQVFVIPAEGRADLTSSLTAVLTAPTTGAATAIENGAPVADATRVAIETKSLRGASPIMINIRQAPEGLESFFFSLPVRAGDVIVVPASGNFIVSGWVAKPGTYPLRGGVTLRGALAIGGGLRFPAKKGRVCIHRLSRTGGTELEEVDFNDVLAARADDVYINDGDVIQVDASAVKLLPWGFYRLFADIVRFGAGIKMVP